MTRDNTPWREASILLHNGTPEWPGDTPYDCGWTWRIAKGASVNLSRVTMSPHVGTHADAPLHVVEGGAASEALPLEAFLGDAWVCDVSGRSGALTIDTLILPPAGAIPRLLLRTSCTIALGAFPQTWPVLSEDTVGALLARGLKLLGVDAPSVDHRESKGLETHNALFKGGAFILENLDLRHVKSGWHELLALPLRIEGLDAAPVRALVRPRL